MKILCATDFSEPAEVAETEALALAGKLRGELIYLHVGTEPMLYGESAFSMGDVRQVYDAQRRWTENMLQARVAGAEATGVTARWVVRTGTGAAYEQIVAAAEEEKADMLVLGTHGRSGLNRLLLGSVAERVVRLACCPVLTVRPRNGA